jgi:hypothetical protein
MPIQRRGQQIQARRRHAKAFASEIVILTYAQTEPDDYILADTGLGGRAYAGCDRSYTMGKVVSQISKSLDEFIT